LWYYEQLELGFHYRMMDIQAALGLKEIGVTEDMPLIAIGIWGLTYVFPGRSQIRGMRGNCGRGGCSGDLAATHQRDRV